MLSGDYKRIVSKLKAGTPCDVEEVRHILGANRDLFEQQRTISDPLTREIRQEGYVDPYRFSDSEVFAILQKNSRLERGQK